jgi:hypothetical protein
MPPAPAPNEKGLQQSRLRGTNCLQAGAACTPGEAHASPLFLIFSALYYMSSILIGYDLNRQGQNYTALIEKIKTLGYDWWHCLDSTWIIKTHLACVQVRDTLRLLLDANDELLVIDVTGDAAAWVGFDTNCSNWLSNKL